MSKIKLVFSYFEILNLCVLLPTYPHTYLCKLLTPAVDIVWSLMMMVIIMMVYSSEYTVLNLF